MAIPIYYNIRSLAVRRTTTLMDDYLRPEMNASLAFYSTPRSATAAPPKPVVVIPSAAVRDSSVFLVVDGRAVRRAVEAAGNDCGRATSISGGLIGGEDVVVDPPANLKDGQKVQSMSP